jgi:hypothetical protein
MATTENVKILLRGDTASNWESFNPVLGKNEAVVEWGNDSTEKRIKIGDGVTRYNALPYTVDEYALRQALEAETAAREEAGTDFQGYLEHEATARGEADAALQGGIDTVAGDLAAEAGARGEADTALQGGIDAALPKADVVTPDDSAAAGQAADAAALYAILQGFIKLVSAATQEIYSNLALKTYVDTGNGQTKAFQLLGTAIDGTEHTLIELAEYGAAQQVEIGSETIHLNLNNLGPVGGDNHITCDTHDHEGAAVKLSVAWLTDVAAQCAATLAGANGYTDDRIEQITVDSLVLQNPCKESELPEGPFDPSHNGYFYQITDFDVSYPGGDRKGSAVWYDSLDNYYLAVDTYKNADEETITENSNGEFMVADVNTGTVIADSSGGFADSVVLGFKAFIAAIAAKINGLFSLIGGLNTAIGAKYTKPAGGIPTSDLALTQAQLDAANSGITAALVTAFGGKQDALTQAQLDAANSGITAALVTAFGAKQDALTQAQLDAANSGITAALVTAFGGKQDALTQAQLDAANSGITAALVTNIGGPDMTAADEAAAEALSTANPTAIVWYPEGA